MRKKWIKNLEAKWNLSANNFKWRKRTELCFCQVHLAFLQRAANQPKFKDNTLGNCYGQNDRSKVVQTFPYPTSIVKYLPCTNYMLGFEKTISFTSTALNLYSGDKPRREKIKYNITHCFIMQWEKWVWVLWEYSWQGNQHLENRKGIISNCTLNQHK